MSVIVRIYTDKENKENDILWTHVPRLMRAIVDVVRKSDPAWADELQVDFIDNARSDHVLYCTEWSKARMQWLFEIVGDIHQQAYQSWSAFKREERMRTPARELWTLLLFDPRVSAPENMFEQASIQFSDTDIWQADRWLYDLIIEYMWTRLIFWYIVEPNFDIKREVITHLQDAQITGFLDLRVLSAEAHRTFAVAIEGGVTYEHDFVHPTYVYEMKKQKPRAFFEMYHRLYGDVKPIYLDYLAEMAKKKISR